ncbi:hypothetical protein U9890_22940, partial [Escherichia coli]
LRTSFPNKTPAISKLELVLDIYPSLSLILRYIYCLVFQGASSYDIISQLHLPQNGYFMERSNFLVAIIRLILRSLAIIPGWFVSLVHEIVTFLFIMEIWGKAGDDFFICIRW